MTKKILFIIIGIIVLIFIGLGFYLPGFYLNQIRVSLDESIPKTMVLTYDDNMETSLFSSFPHIEVEFKDIILKDSVSSEVFLSAEKLDLKANVVSLMTGKGVNIERLKIDKIAYSENNIYINELDVKYNGKTPSSRRELQNISFSADGIKIESEKIAEFDLDFIGKIYTTLDDDINDLHLDIEKSEIILNDKTHLDLNGFVKISNSKTSYDLDVTSAKSIRLSEISELIIGSLDIDGDCDLEFNIKDPMATGDYTVSTSIRLDNGAMIYNDVQIDSISFVAVTSLDNIKGEIIDLQSFSAKIDGAEILGVGKYTENIDKLQSFEVATDFTELDIQSLNRLSPTSDSETSIIDNCEGKISGTINYKASLLEDKSINKSSIVSNGDMDINTLIVKNTDILKSISEYVKMDKNGDLEIENSKFIFTIDDGILSVKKLDFDLMTNCPTSITGTQNIITDRLNYKLVANIDKKLFDTETASMLSALGLTKDKIELVLDIKGTSENPKIDINIKESITRNKDKSKPAKSGSFLDLIMNFI